MYEKLNKLGLRLTFLVAVVLVAVSVIAYANTGSVELFMDVAYVFLGLGVLMAVLLPLYNARDNVKSLAKSFAGLGGLVLIFLLCRYVFSSGTTSVESMSDALILTTWVILSIAVIGVLVTEIRKVIS